MRSLSSRVSVFTGLLATILLGIFSASVLLRIQEILEETAQADLARLFRSAGIDAIQLRTDQPYGAALGRFFETRERRRLRG